MNVLLAARDLSGIGGVQSWVRTVAMELLRRGYTVGEVSPNRDKCFGVIPRWDVGVFAHGAETSQWFERCDRTLLVSHGIIEPERPVPGADAYAFVSEECRDHWARDGGWTCDDLHPDGAFLVGEPAPVIRQPIDCDFWSPGDQEVSAERPYVYRHSYYGGLDFLPDLCNEMGYAFYHGKSMSPQIARDMCRGAACVISSGRGALEAMACGVPTVIADHRPYAGPLVGYAPQERVNYSGRGPQRHPATPEEVRRALKGRDLGGWREYVIEHHAAPMIVDQLLEAAGLPLGQEEEVIVAPV